MRLSIALLAAFVAVCSAVSNPIQIVPVGKEYIYKFNTKVFVGTKEPNVFASSYAYTGNLHIVGLKPDLFGVSIQDVLYKIENGQYKVPIVDPITPIPLDASPLTIPFMIETDPSGKVVAVLTNSTDLEWSVNMKKAMASNFQLTALEQIKSEEVTEDTIYGSCPVNYQVVSQGEVLRLIKTLDASKCGNSMHLKESKDFVSTDNAKIYELELKDGKYRIKSIRGEGEIIAHPKGVKNENGFVSVMQLFDFVSEQDSGLTAPIDKGVRSTLKYNDQVEKCRDVALQKVVDVSGGRHVTLTKVLIQKIENLLEQIVRYFDDNHITLMKPEMKNLNLVNQILFELENADLSVLEQTFAMLLEKSKTEIEMRKMVIFIEILPFIGTRPSAIMIRNLIRKEKIEDGSVVQRVLSNLPDQIQCPTEKLLFELEDMMNLKFDNETVYEVSVLSYAALIRRTFEDIDENSIILEKYIEQFQQKYTEESDYNMKMLYLECMGNVKVGSVMKRFMKLLQTETDTGIRVKILRIISPILQSDTKLLLQTTWPILTDRSADMKLRLMAYILYVTPKEPTVNHFMNLYWLMRYEPNERMYSFHYRTIKSLSKNPDFFENSRTLADISKMVLRISRKPLIKANEGYYVAETVDKKNGFGLRMDVTAIADKDGGDVAIRLFKKFNEEISEIGSVYGAYYNRSLHLVTHRNGRTNNLIQLSSADPEKIFYQMTALLGGGVKNDDTLETLLVPISFEKVVPSDIGAPVKLYDRMSVIVTFQLKMEKLENFELDFRMQHVIARSLGMKAYNPLNDLWHGLQELKTISANIPINVAAELEEASFKLIFKSNQDPKYRLGLQYYGESQVFVENIVEKKDLELLGVAEVSEHYVKIGRDFVKPKEMTIIDGELDNLGQDFKLKIFECDRDISLGQVQKVLDSSDELADFGSLNFMKFQPSLLFEAGVGSCGVGFQMSPMKNIDRLEFIGAYDRIGETGNKSDSFSLAMNVISTENVTLSTDKLSFNVFTRNLELEPDTRSAALVKGNLSSDKASVEFSLKVKVTTTDFESKLEMALHDDSADKNKVEFTLKGMRSAEQMNTSHILSKQCKQELFDDYELMPISRKCFRTETSLRKYVIKGVMTSKSGEKVRDIEIVFPLLRENEVDMKIDGEFKEGMTSLIEGIDMEDIHSVMPPFNTFFGFFNVDLDDDRPTCLIGSKHLLKTNNMKVLQPITKDYDLYFLNKNTEENTTVSVSAKMGAIGSKVAFKFDSYGDVMECEPLVEGFECKLNGTVLKDPSYTVINENMRRIVTTNPHLLLIQVGGILVVYDGLTVRLEMRPYLTRSTTWYGDVVEGHCVV